MKFWIGQHKDQAHGGAQGGGNGLYPLEIGTDKQKFLENAKSEV